MGIRETLNENPRLTTGVTIGIIVLILGLIIYQIVGGGSGSSVPQTSNKAYFSDDDGKNYFADDATKIPPFDHNGKEAVRAHVYKCDGKTFVNHLERFKPDAKAKLEQMSKPGSGDPTMGEALMTQGRQAKRPGDKDWVRSNDQRFGEVTRWQCKDTENMTEVLP